MSSKHTAAGAWLALSLATIPGTSAWAIEKCTDASGKITFQEKSCDGAAKPDAIPKAFTRQAPQAAAPSVPRPPMGDPEYERKREAERARAIDQYGKEAGADLRARVDLAIKECGTEPPTPYIGASAAWIRSCSSWGAPNGINTTTTANGKSEQWVYRHRGNLYLTNGVVSAIQN